MYPATAPEPGRRTASIGLASLVLLGIVSFFPNGPTWSTIALVALGAIGVAAGMAAGRWLDVIAVAAAGALAVFLVGVMQLFAPGGPTSYTSILTAAFWVGGLAAIFAGATFAIRRAVR
jgi:energy-coupling factor transporter transmembrane protein EcfT